MADINGLIPHAFESYAEILKYLQNEKWSFIKSLPSEYLSMGRVWGVHLKDNMTIVVYYLNPITYNVESRRFAVNVPQHMVDLEKPISNIVLNLFDVTFGKHNVYDPFTVTFMKWGFAHDGVVLLARTDSGTSIIWNPTTSTVRDFGDIDLGGV